MSHNHDHGPTPEKALWVALILNAAFLVLETILGLWTNSLALLSDAGHMLSDVSALIIALLAHRLTRKKPSAQFTFGLQRAPVLGGLINGISLLLIVIFILRESVERLQSPPEINARIVFLTGLAGLFINLMSAWYLARSQDQSVNTRGAMLHLLADAFGSIAAILSAGAIYYFDFYLADPITSVIIALLILVGSLPLVRDTIYILLQRAPNHIRVDDVRKSLLEQEHIDDVYTLQIWELDSGNVVCATRLHVTAHHHTEDVTAQVRHMLHDEFGIENATIELGGHELEEHTHE